MSGLPDVPAARVIEAIEGLLFSAEEKVSWEMVRAARRLLGTLVPEEPPSLMKPLSPSPAALAEALDRPMIVTQAPHPTIEPPPRPPTSPRRSPKPQGQSTGSPSLTDQVRESLGRLSLSSPSVAPMAIAKDIGNGVTPKKAAQILFQLVRQGEARKIGVGLYTSA
jgi:hypothetical protein